MLILRDEAVAPSLWELANRLGVDCRNRVVHSAALLLERSAGLDLGFRYCLRSDGVWSPDLAVELDDLAEQRRAPRYILPAIVRDRIADVLGDGVLTNSELHLLASMALLSFEHDYAGAIDQLVEHWPAEDVRAAAWWCVFNVPDGPWRAPLQTSPAQAPATIDPQSHSVAILSERLNELVRLGKCLGVQVDVGITPIAGWVDPASRDDDDEALDRQPPPSTLRDQSTMAVAS